MADFQFFKWIKKRDQLRPVTLVDYASPRHPTNSDVRCLRSRTRRTIVCDGDKKAPDDTYGGSEWLIGQGEVWMYILTDFEMWQPAKVTPIERNMQILQDESPVVVKRCEWLRSVC